LGRPRAAEIQPFTQQPFTQQPFTQQPFTQQEVGEV
jgi:hypothetical protein